MPAHHVPQRNTIRLERSSYVGGGVFHITICLRRPAKLDTDAQFDLVAEHLARHRLDAHGPLAAYVVMPDHVHVLAVASTDLVAWVGRFKGGVTLAARKRAISMPPWQASFYDHGVRHDEGVSAVARYIVENPLRAGIVKTVDEWKWWWVHSTL